jgi:hypothetical protein
MQQFKNVWRKRKCACVILYKDSGAFKTNQQNRKKFIKEQTKGSHQGATRFFVPNIPNAVNHYGT